MDNIENGRPLTGRKVLLITVTAFAIVIGANLALVYAALGSFPGLEVKNSYVASQSFDRDRTAQEALGWVAQVSYQNDRVTLALTDSEGNSVTPAEITGRVGRATHVADDQALAFAPGSQGLVAPARLDTGLWRVWVEARSDDGTLFRQRLDLRVGT